VGGGKISLMKLSLEARLRTDTTSTGEKARKEKTRYNSNKAGGEVEGSQKIKKPSGKLKQIEISKGSWGGDECHRRRTPRDNAVGRKESCRGRRK